ncbi:hypothetical protein E3Q23_03112 [Wallemia mellicola]|nr:hypothetical protein E3Q23_03112 [Wallemia mellicola]
MDNAPAGSKAAREAHQEQRIRQRGGEIHKSAPLKLNIPKPAIQEPAVSPFAAPPDVNPAFNSLFSQLSATKGSPVFRDSESPATGSPSLGRVSRLSGARKDSSVSLSSRAPDSQPSRRDKQLEHDLFPSEASQSLRKSTAKNTPSSRRSESIRHPDSSHSRRDDSGSIEGRAGSAQSQSSNEQTRLSLQNQIQFGRNVSLEKSTRDSSSVERAQRSSLEKPLPPLPSHEDDFDTIPESAQKMNRLKKKATKSLDRSHKRPRVSAPKVAPPPTPPEELDELALRPKEPAREVPKVRRIKTSEPRPPKPRDIFKRPILPLSRKRQGEQLGQTAKEPSDRKKVPDEIFEYKALIAPPNDGVDELIDEIDAKHKHVAGRAINRSLTVVNELDVVWEIVTDEIEEAIARAQSRTMMHDLRHMMSILEVGFVKKVQSYYHVIGLLARLSAAKTQQKELRAQLLATQTSRSEIAKNMAQKEKEWHSTKKARREMAHLNIWLHDLEESKMEVSGEDDGSVDRIPTKLGDDYMSILSALRLIEPMHTDGGTDRTMEEVNMLYELCEKEGVFDDVEEEDDEEDMESVSSVHTSDIDSSELESLGGDSDGLSDDDRPAGSSTRGISSNSQDASIKSHGISLGTGDVSPSTRQDNTLTRMPAKNASQTTNKALSARKQTLKGGQTNKSRKVRTQVHFYKPKTLRLPRDPKYPRKSIPSRGQLDQYQVIQLPVNTEAAMKKVEDDNTLVFLVDRRANKRQIKDAVKKLYDVDAAKVNTLIRPDASKKAFIRLTPDHDALDVANRIGLL